ncbi:MAG TPA: glycoside hydrolase xylanase [Prevotellaceae bacterium]|nr:glycoside hydrolase xylanase [Prevotellaceae bacterium]
MKKTFIACAMAILASSVSAEDEMIKYGNFDTWITRDIRESILVGGKRQTLYEVGPKGRFDGQRAFTNQGNCPWANSNVYAKVAGVVKTNVSVYPDNHPGHGKCVKLTTHIVKCKAIGIINISVLAAGSIYTGTMEEPITSSSNPMAKMSIGMPFSKRPKALKFDYKYYTPGNANRIRETGFSKKKVVPGKDMGECMCLLQKRWEDDEGNIHALRVGTMRHRFSENTQGWVENKAFTIHYGDIRHKSFFQNWMGLITGDRVFYAKNSKGKLVPVTEEGWADADTTPTHIVVKFDSSHGGAYVGTVGNTLWIDNVRLVY